MKLNKLLLVGISASLVGCSSKNPMYQNFNFARSLSYEIMQNVYNTFQTLKASGTASFESVEDVEAEYKQSKKETYTYEVDLVQNKLHYVYNGEEINEDRVNSTTTNKITSQEYYAFYDNKEGIIQYKTENGIKSREVYETNAQLVEMLDETNKDQESLVFFGRKMTFDEFVKIQLITFFTNYVDETVLFGPITFLPEFMDVESYASGYSRYQSSDVEMTKEKWDVDFNSLDLSYELESKAKATYKSSSIVTSGDLIESIKTVITNGFCCEYKVDCAFTGKKVNGAIEHTVSDTYKGSVENIKDASVIIPEASEYKPSIL